MTEISKGILSSFQVRKTRKQKEKFISYIRLHFSEARLESEGFPSNNNIILGNIAESSVILSAHYDTCARLPFPNFITPMNPFFSILYSILIVVPMFFIVWLLNLGLNLITTNFWVHYFLSIVVLFGLLALIMVGPANKHTVNDNTSGIITLCEIYTHLPAELRRKVAFVFFDNEEKGLFGSSAFRKKYKKEITNKLLINFDCVSDGDNILLSVNKKARSQFGQIIEKTFPATESKKVLVKKAEKTYYPSDQAGFPMSIAVAALNHKKYIGYYMDKIHTNKDTVLDERNINYLRDQVIRFLQAIHT